MHKIGLFGGTFDPPHRAHLRMARAFAAQIGLDEVILIPAGDPYHKTQPTRTAARHRLEMCLLAVAGEPLFSVSNVDIVRKGATYTYDTVRILRQMEPEAQYWWLIGSDSLKQIHTWHRYRDLLCLINFAVAWREDDAIEKLSEEIHTIIAAGQKAVAVGAFAGQIRFLDLPPENLSSTVIRERLQSGVCVDDLIDKTVSAYIRTNALYAASDRKG